MSDADGWVKHDGGACPVPKGTPIRIWWKGDAEPIKEIVPATPDGDAWRLGAIGHYMVVESQPEQAHAMSHPAAQGESVQHVSDDAYAAYRAWCPFDPMQRPDYDEAHSSMGTVLRTVAEWRNLESYQRDYEREVVLSSNRWGELCKAREMIADLQRQLAEVRDVRNSVVETAAVDADNVHVRGKPRDIPVYVVSHNALTFLPDYDARLGRGNAAMDAA